jgi:isopropylmalate/homocitrate/citramalate synthase
MTKDKLITFDTTLHDGEQSPGVLIARERKFRISCAGETIRSDLGEV